MTPGTVVSVVNSYAATSEYTPARLLRRVDFPTDGKPTNPIRASPVFATSKPTNKEAKLKKKKKKRFKDGQFLSSKLLDCERPLN